MNTIQYDCLRKVDTFHGTDYYIILIMPSGYRQEVQISEIDYINLKNLEEMKK